MLLDIGTAVDNGQKKNQKKKNEKKGSSSKMVGMRIIHALPPVHALQLYLAIVALDHCYYMEQHC